MAILAIIMLPMYNVLQVAMKSWKFEDTRSEVVQNARIAMERMTHEIRHTKRDAQNRVLEVAEAERIKFWKDANVDGVVDAGETIEYNKQDTDLVRIEDGTTTDELANYVSSFSIEYRNQGYQPMSPPVTGADLADIKFITITLTIENKGHSAVVRTSLHPRNI